eukprot:TRINITY_DN4654_c0_g1_i7.p1 TRINITY_DN4654_c0_g1~~TRINITY_DN4654_c0_g1_i7.p1  ORF type:complete len:337 (-),score=143.70 TRINITY_DN4654_c0_g1_i7:84-1094(-)
MCIRDRYMGKEGKSLNKEMLELIEKKQTFIDHLKILKGVMDTYIKAQDKPFEVVDPEKIRNDTKAEMERLAAGTRSEELRRLSQFFVIAEILKEKDHISPIPFTKVPPQKQEEILNNFNSVATLSRNRETSIQEEIEKLTRLFQKLMQRNDYVESVARNAEVAGSKFKINEGPEQEFVMLQPADKLEMSEKVAEEPAQHQVDKKTKEEPPARSADQPKKEEVKAAKEPQKELRKEPRKEPRREQRREDEKKAPKQSTEEEQPREGEDQEEEEFEVAMSKAQKREMNARQGRGQRKGRKGKFRQRESGHVGESQEGEYEDEKARKLKPKPETKDKKQ